MTVRRRGQKLVIDYYPEGRKGSRKWVTLDERIQDEAIAREIEAELKKAAREPEELELQPAMLISEAFPEYLKWYKLHRAEKSWEDISYCYNRSIERILGEVVIKDINLHHITLYKTMRKAEKVTAKSKAKGIHPVRDLSNRTINKELSYISGFLRWCKDKYGITHRPFQVESLPYKRPIPMPLTFDECMSILEAAEPIYKGFFLCLFILGLRKSEARNLSREDIDRSNMTITVRQKGGSYKVLPASELLIEVLDRINPQVKKGPIFLNTRLKPPRPILNYRKALIRAAKKAEIKKKVTPHIFRHSIAKYLMDHDVNMRIIQQFLGHSRISTTEYYTQVFMDNLRSAEALITARMQAFYSHKNKQ
jgi:integrase/recombinase XerD